VSPGRTVAIIGAGFSGTTIAVHLLRSAPETVGRLYLVERADRNVGGVAYQTPAASHTLNVPAGRMSAFEDDPDDFLRFVRLREPSLTGGSFVPRRLYGEYLTETLERARRESGLSLLRVAGEVVAIEEKPEDLVLRLGDGRVLKADHAVVAIGNYPPSDPPAADLALAESIRYARDPWSRDALETDRDEDVLLVGTGLTMCDIALALRDADHQGRIHAISRRGLLPQPHRVSAKPPPHLDRPQTIDEWPGTALGMLRGLRREVRDKGRGAVDWREVVTSIRHDTPALWQRLDTDERRRFLDHLRPYWETHRHRSSPETALGVAELIEAGRLHVIAGRLERLSDDGDAVLVTFSRRGTTTLESLRVGKVLNCSGPDTDLARVRDPLVAALRRDGLIRPDELGLGLDSDEDGRVIAADGRTSSRLSLVGPLRKGRLWENTAVPELRVEAKRMSERLASEAAMPWQRDRSQPEHAESASPRTLGA
jgi:uncharacterized NAD(P)/FAD-binding protein YdhS